MMSFDPKKPVETRDGRSARIVSTKIGANAFGDTLGAIVVEKDGTETYHTFQRNGYYSLRESPTDLDLINIGARTTQLFAMTRDYGISSGPRRTRIGADDGLAQAADRSAPWSGKVLKVTYEGHEPTKVELI